MEVLKVKIKFSKRTIVAIVTALLSLLGCATKVVVDGISVEIADSSIQDKNAELEE